MEKVRLNDQGVGKYTDCTGLGYLGAPASAWNEAAVGVVIAHLCHFLSVFVIYELSRTIRPLVSSTSTDRFSFLAAGFHIISPAGIFLSAPYAESLFSLLNFSGMYLYATAHAERNSLHQRRSDALVVIAGLVFGLATTVRSNGLLSGMIFLYDAIVNAISILWPSNASVHFRSLCVTTMAGILMSFGTIIPQYLAYKEYCWTPTGDLRPWCSATFPSIYAWVQKHYWYADTGECRFCG